MSGEPYEQLASLAEAELELVEAGRLEELDELYARGAALIAALPARAPAAARPALERAAAAQAAVGRRLAAELAAADSELDRLRRGRGAARAYGASARAGSPA